MRTSERDERSDRRLRTWLMFTGALSGTLYEAIGRSAERPFLLTLYASMMGLPFVIGRAGKAPEEE